MSSLFSDISSDFRLSLKDISCERGEARLFSGLSFDLSPGEIIWLQGSNGIGKTSLLRIAAGLARPHSGTVHWQSGAAECGAPDIAGYQAHADALKAKSSVTDELSFWARLSGTQGRVGAAMEYVGLTSKSNLPTGKLSAGQKRRAALARLLLADKPIWIMDEPAASMDASGQTLIQSMIKAHIARGGAALIASHAPAMPLSGKTRTLTFEAQE